MKRFIVRRAAVVVAAFAAGTTLVAPAGAATPTIVVQRGQPVQIAFANDLTGSASSFSASLSNAVRMAIGFHPTVRGFPVQLNAFDAPCGDASADAATATAIASNPQNAGVIGQLCSFGFAEALPIYQAAGVVTISGSTTNPALGAMGFSVFNTLAVVDPNFDSWYAIVGALPSDVAWQHGYGVIFGGPPTTFADLYYDATTLLISDLRRVSHVERGGALVIDRAALARAVRSTRNLEGVACTVTLDRATGNRVDDPAALARCAGSDEESVVEGQAVRAR